VSDPQRLAASRQCVLALTVLDDVDMLRQDGGVLLPGPSDVFVSWDDIADALGPHDPASAVGRGRVSSMLRLRRMVADLGDQASTRLRQAARLLALPPEHALHPGPGWVRGRLPGGCLDLGIGLLGLNRSGDGVRPLPASVAAPAGIEPSDWWPDLTRHVDRMGSLVAQRLARDTRCLIRPSGGCDVPSLLASPTLRRALADQDGTGLRAVAIPTRAVAWYDLGRVDPAFVAAVWQLTAEPDRGLGQPVLVTADEVTTPRCGPEPRS
jgi:hypothetical protein